VARGATALLVLIGKVLVQDYQQALPDVFLNTDPLRILEAIIVGISFLGAGTILKVEEQFRIRFLTTAASILFSAGIGITAALHYWLLAVGLTILIVIINFGFGYLEHILQNRNR